ncbi:RrF2 family transcriptional regulator [Couchioplanes caeruleus]|uniref:Rrf2 family transcriptional regulator n=2 Tax=Couchioplanes caeruleus TaxID=56438 RepID=A0A1K0FI47_9ACTN|nr:Rrf2 family transcriptional regulator [Couchioplanes caeruleus]OJF12505.1 Rrf2 family transcriptional regulator [Couchioplanes caeruleus subsp. caeruleus]ROP32124.1 BadM/Rrf2 family transcriptional regulator [Couchioplanes caeruleus]
MYVSARTDYAVRAMLAIAADHPHLVKAADLAAAQDIPLSFLQGILLDLRRAGLLHSHRGVDGGYALARPADEVTVGDVVRASGGALTTVRGLPTTTTTYHGVATGLKDVWLAVEEAIEGVVDHRTLAELAVPAIRTI